MRRVIHVSGLRGLPGTWQNLAEQSCCKAMKSAGSGHRAAAALWRGPGGGRSSVQMTPVQVIARCLGRAADAPDRGADQKRKAAGGRVGRESDPGRQGQRDGCTHRQKPDRRGQENEPCKHFAQPPRENCGQDARPTWQEYGRVLVKIRQRTETFPPFARPLDRESRVVSAFGGACQKAQPKVVTDRRPEDALRNHLKQNRFSKCWPNGPRTPDPCFLSGGRPGSGAAAIWRNPDSAIRACVPEPDKDCLSFVMPQKQGGAAAGQGDTR